MILFNLPVGYDLQAAMARFRQEWGRPIYTVGPLHVGIMGGVHKLPGEKKYRKLTREEALKAWLIGLEEGYAQGRDERGVLFDPQPSSTLSLMVPKIPDEGKQPPFKEVFTPPFFPSWKARQGPFSWASKDEMPSEWQPYAVLRRVVYGGTHTRRFVLEGWEIGSFWAPTIQTTEWQLDGEALVGPGQRPQLEAHPNEFGIVNRDPSECVICCGTRGERRMLGVWNDTGAGRQFTNPMCLACCKEAFPQWLALMEAQSSS